MRVKLFAIFLVSVILFAGLGAFAQQNIADKGYLTFPFSEFVIRSDWAMPIVWKYRPFEHIKENETVIAPPEVTEDWNSWYKTMKSYQAYLRSNLNDSSALYLQMAVSKGKNVRLHYKRVLNDMRLQPGDKITFNGFAKDMDGTAQFQIKVIYIKIGQEKSHAIVKTEFIDSISIGKDWTSLHHEFRLPVFDTATLMVQPVIFFGSADTMINQLQINGLTLSIPPSRLNKEVYERLRPSFYPKTTAIDKQLYDRKEMSWIKNNFISGFAFLWDQDIWDADKKVFTIQKYCDKMKKEFGGFQSVLFWYSYPNLGIDQRNTWEFLTTIPGGVNSLKAIVQTFHDNGVKVYFPYTSWEIDTRKTSKLTDPAHWAQIIGQTDADGLFFDVFFDAGDFQHDLDKVKKGLSIGTEHHPSLQNIQGYNALTSSWGQTIQPFNNNGISRVKWLIPEHKQWTINRNAVSRQNSMAYSWINGQGILIWENVFGYMNTWNAQDRKDLRKINAIYQLFADLYNADSWEPYLPAGSQEVHISSWENNNAKIWNIVTDSVSYGKKISIPITDSKIQYYDLWTGEPLVLTDQKIIVSIARFGCVLGIKNKPSTAILTLLDHQKSETKTALSDFDPYVNLLSDKYAFAVPRINPSVINLPDKLLKVNAGIFKQLTKHFKREGYCFPDTDAKNNNDYKEEINAYGKDLIVHHHTLTTGGFTIMDKVVSNGEFEIFLKSSQYVPKDTTAFLRHWKGSICPDSIKNLAVVYVSLDDARAYAKWAGMRLPTEWEWQLAGEQYGRKFSYNEVWEWNESERFDGHNHFVSLRGGCRNWKLQTSDWYFPGTANDQKPGGDQPLDSHCKYYIMKTGYDRAATIGFRCLK